MMEVKKTRIFPLSAFGQVREHKSQMTSVKGWFFIAADFSWYRQYHNRKALTPNGCDLNVKKILFIERDVSSLDKKISRSLV
jgi:hypothetical protein